MRGHQLSGMLGPLESADLGFGIDAVDACTSLGVPESDGPVGRAAARGQHVLLEGAPRQRLHRRVVLVEGVTRGIRSLKIPDVEQVVVTARCQLGAVRGPTQTANLLIIFFVSFEEKAQEKRKEEVAEGKGTKKLTWVWCSIVET